MIGTGIHDLIQNLLRAYSGYVTQHLAGVHLNTLDTFTGMILTSEFCSLAPRRMVTYPIPSPP